MTKVQSHSPSAGDIVSFRFPKREGPTETARPCLVLEADDNEVLIAYGTTSTTSANRGLELWVRHDTGACGLHRPTRFVAARRIRVRRDDDRLVLNDAGTPVIGHLTQDLEERLCEILAVLGSTSIAAERKDAEREGIHPKRNRKGLFGQGRDVERSPTCPRVEVIKKRAFKTPVETGNAA